MAATTPTGEPASVTAVSSPSARLLYYELAEQEEATLEELDDAVDYDADRVRDLLSVLGSHGLVTENDGTYRV